MTELETQEAEAKAFLERKIAEQMKRIQDIVDRNMRETHKSVEVIDEDEIKEFCERVTEYVSFELDEDGGLEEGMPVDYVGPGGYVILSKEGDLVDTDALPPGDMIVGVVDSCLVLTVASQGYMNAHLDRDAVVNPLEITKSDVSMSGGIVLTSAWYLAGLRTDGSYVLQTDLTDFDVVIPTIYEAKPKSVKFR